MTDESGHQLPNYRYPGLEKGELIEWVERFYSEFYFRPKVAFRLVANAIFDSADRKRLYKEAREYLALRTKRRKYVKDQKAERDQKEQPVLSSGD